MQLEIKTNSGSFILKVQIFLSKEEFKESGLHADLSISVSKAKTYDTCKAKFKYQYIQKLPKKEWEHLTFGTFMHAVLERFHKAVIENSDCNWEDELKNAWAESVKEFKDKLTGEQKLEAGPLVKEYRDLLRESGLPKVIKVEDPFNIIIENDEVSIYLNGFIDRTQIDEDGVLHVADYKTTKDLKYLKKDFFQLKVYAFVLMLADPSLEKVRCSYIGLRHNFKFITKEYGREIIDEVAEKLIQYAKEISEEKMWRPQPQPLCKYCDFQDVCKAGERYLVKIGVKDRKVGQISWS